MNRLVIVSNRVPEPADGKPSAGGLAVALSGLMERRGGLWFGWSGKTAADAATRAPVVTQQGGVDYATIDLTRTEHERYYNNFSNGVLWPVLHNMAQLMDYAQRDALAYRNVNQRFADALRPLLRPDDVLWIHDYHLMAMPALLREKGVRNPIGFFLHIPFAAPDVVAQAPDMQTLVHDLLSADLVGFQTRGDLDNFAATCRLIGGTLSRDGTEVTADGRLTRLGVFPVEIDARAFAATAATSVRGAACQRLRTSLGSQALILGVDRLDPTKGLPQRLAGLRRLLERHPELHRRATLLQIAAVSRQDVSAYRELRLAIDRDAGAINSEFADPDWSPLRLTAKAGARSTIAGYMRMARVGLVTPLRDGMNLVAKEYVAAQDQQDPGVLILSRFAGAAHQLPQALLVNPYDADDLADAIERALRMELSERQERWNAMWQTLQQVSPVGWGRAFLGALTAGTAGGPEGRVRSMGPELYVSGLRPSREGGVRPARWA